MSVWDELIEYIGADEEALQLLSDGMAEVRAEQTRSNAVAICKWAEENRGVKGYQLSTEEWLGARLVANVLYGKATQEWDQRGVR